MVESHQQNGPSASKEAGVRKVFSVPRVEKNEKSGCMIVFFSLFLVLGLVVLYLFSIRPLWGVVASRNWVELPCKIVFSDVRDHGDTYSVDITFEFLVEGDSHVGYRYSFLHELQNSNRSAMQAVVNQYPPGSKAVCYADPDDPEHSVLNRAFSWHMLWGLAGLLFAGVGIAGIIPFRKKSPVGRQTDGTGSSNTNRNQVESCEEPVQAIDNAALELASELSPGKMLAGVVFFTVIWNSFCALFFLGGPDGWFDVMFSIPFWLIGVALVFWSFYCLAAMFNPWPTLTLSRSGVSLGETAILSWQFQGDIGRVERLSISVKAEEHATFARGTDRHTDKEVFYQQDLVVSEKGYPDISSGGVELNIPSDTMHSFKSENNAVVWVIEVNGKRRFRPKICARFPIQVRPLHVEN